MIERPATRFPRVLSFASKRLTDPPLRAHPRLWRDIAALAVPATGVIVLAEFGRDLPLLATALVLASIGAVSRPVLGAALVLVAASDPSLFRGHALGPLTGVDLLIGAVVARAALIADRRHPSWLEWSALGFLAAAAVATVVAHSGSAPTAFARVGSYLVLGLVVGRALRLGDRPLLTQVFIGSQAGQAFAAFTSITGTTTTDFPFGRYLGTLGDPAQFGIPIAFAAVLLAVSRNAVRDTVLRATLLILFVGAVAGSATRSAWSVAGVGGLLALAQRVGRGRSIGIRLALASGVFAALAAGTVLVVIGAGVIGLNPSSAELRRRSIETAWTYLTRHPTHPAGLGNNPAPQSEEPAAASRSRNLIPNSSFERRRLSWVAFRGAKIRRSPVDVVSGRTSLSVSTAGRTIEEGVATASPVAGVRGDATYTFSIYAKIRPDVPLWLYVDEYDASNRWLTYSYSTVTGTGEWKRLTRTWRTEPATAEARLFVVTAQHIKTTLTLDAAQLERGGTASAYVAGRRHEVTQSSVTYNTWLAVAISLGVVAASLLAVLAAGAAYHAYRLGDDAFAIALVAILVPSLTENFVYATSFVTLIWFAALGLTVTAHASVARRSAASHD
jgi:Carbohydrate binding domain